MVKKKTESALPITQSSHNCTKYHEAPRETATKKELNQLTKHLKKRALKYNPGF